MKLRHGILTALIVLYCAGCARIPFQEVSYAPVGAVEPEAVREQFAASLPSAFELISTIVFEYRWHSFTALGYTSIDSDRKRFTVVGLTPVGIKLFELAGDGDSVECRFAMEEFTKQGDFAGAVGGDIRRIYFDRAPGPDAVAHKEKTRIVFKKASATDVMEYVFAGAGNELVEKRYYKDNHKIWTVYYYEYRRKDGKLYPAGIILKHHRYGYRLIVRLKEIRS